MMLVSMNMEHRCGRVYCLKDHILLLLTDRDCLSPHPPLLPPTGALYVIYHASSHRNHFLLVNLARRQSFTIVILDY